MNLAKILKTLSEKLNALAANIETNTADISGKANSSHTHSAGDITSGTIPAARIADKSITKAKLEQSVQTSLGNADRVSGLYQSSATLQTVGNVASIQFHESGGMCVLRVWTSAGNRDLIF